MELVHSFNIKLSSEISEKIKAEQVKLSEKFEEKRFYDSSPHLSIGVKFMQPEDSPRFLEALQEEFKNDKVWELELGNFSISDTGNYVFLNLSLESTQYIYDLHERMLKASMGVGFENQNNDPVPKYPYHPHLSIIKLPLEHAQQALSLLKTDLVGIKMPVSEYFITRQQIDEKGFSTFPIVLEINLTK